jgi:hypothetical protein
MFHVLETGIEILRAWPEKEATKVICDLKVRPRCAISQQRFNTLLNNNKLNKNRCCQACFRKMQGYLQRS